LEVALEQLNQRQIGRGLAVRDRQSFQGQAPALGEEFELIEETGFADTWLPQDADNLAMPGGGLRERAPQLLLLGLTADKACQAPAGGDLQARAQRPYAPDLIDGERLVHPFDLRLAQRFELEVTLRQLVGVLGDENSAGVRQLLHPRRQIG